jgi:hypothetical protein
MSAGKAPASAVILFAIALFFAGINGLYAQIEFPAGDFWSLDGGLGTSSFLVAGRDTGKI